jgi:hypothetical protein
VYDVSGKAGRRAHELARAERMADDDDTGMAATLLEAGDMDKRGTVLD